MKCENCGNDLVGASIVCRHCNHNNAQGRVSQWRARRSGELKPVPAAAQATATRTISPLASPAADPKPEIKHPLAEVRTLEPKTSLSNPFEQTARSSQPPTPLRAAAAPAADNSEIVELPAWRAQLKEKVKQVRERRSGELTPINTQPDEAQLDPNPIVESALKRIRWSQHNSPELANPAAVRQTAAVETKQDSESHIQAESKVETHAARPVAQPRPAPQTKPAMANPLLARKPLTQPATRPEANEAGARDTGSLDQRPTAKAAKPETTSQAQPSAEVRVRIEPATEAQTTAPKIRTTGEIKPSPSPARTDSGSLAQPPRNHVETKVIGLAPALNAVVGYANSGALGNAKTAQAKTAQKAADTNPFAKSGTATLWVRTLAGACDFEIVAVAYLPLFAAYAMLDTSFGLESISILFVLLAALTFCYQFLALTIANRTTGMAFLKLRLVNIADKDKPVSVSKKTLRAAGATVAAFLSPINFLVMQSNPQHHSLPDLISGTTLIERTPR